MTDLQVLEFIQEYMAEIQVKAAAGSPVCSELIVHFERMRAAADPDLSRAERYRFEASIKEFLDFKSKGLL